MTKEVTDYITPNFFKISISISFPKKNLKFIINK